MGDEEEGFLSSPQYDFIRRNFGSRNVFFLLLSVAIHNVFEGMQKFTTVFILCFCRILRQLYKASCAIVFQHSHILGITLGLQNNLSNATSIFIGISLHTSLLSFVVSLTTIKAWTSFPDLSLSKCAFIQLIMCSFRPIGIMFGLLVQNTEDENTNVISAILMSLSTGVFLHVTFISLIPSEFFGDIKGHCGSSTEEDSMANYGPFYEEETEANKDDDKAFRPTSFTPLYDENNVVFTSFKVLFFICGWVTLSLCTLLTAGHHQ